MDESLYSATRVNFPPDGNTQVFLLNCLAYNFTQIFISPQEKVCLPTSESSPESYLSIHYVLAESKCMLADAVKGLLTSTKTSVKLHGSAPD